MQKKYFAYILLNKTTKNVIPDVLKKKLNIKIIDKNGKKHLILPFNNSAFNTYSLLHHYYLINKYQSHFNNKAVTSEKYFYISILFELKDAKIKNFNSPYSFLMYNIRQIK